jgi:protein-S-isoprenylcysteine O-methyltransferase Ste14
LAFGAALFALLPVVALRRARTTITPHHPEQARVLVQSGIYRISRNPMYLSLLLALLALCAWRVSLPGLLPAFGFMYLVERLQIRREEAALAARFGRDYQAYCHTTRRWL